MILDFESISQVNQERLRKAAVNSFSLERMSLHSTGHPAQCSLTRVPNIDLSIAFKVHDMIPVKLAMASILPVSNPLLLIYPFALLLLSVS